MSYELPKCKITVLKTLLYQDLADEYRVDAANYVPCERFEVGQEIIIDHPYVMPENFCPWAWADIRQYILAAWNGSDYATVACCTDGFRPVFFKVERIA